MTLHAKVCRPDLQRYPWSLGFIWTKIWKIPSSFSWLDICIIQIISPLRLICKKCAINFHREPAHKNKHKQFNEKIIDIDIDIFILQQSFYRHHANRELSSLPRAGVHFILLLQSLYLTVWGINAVKRVNLSAFFNLIENWEEMKTLISRMSSYFHLIWM